MVNLFRAWMRNADMPLGQRLRATLNLMTLRRRLLAERKRAVIR